MWGILVIWFTIDIIINFLTRNKCSEIHYEIPNPPDILVNEEDLVIYALDILSNLRKEYQVYDPLIDERIRELEAKFRIREWVVYKKQVVDLPVKGTSSRKLHGAK